MQNKKKGYLFLFDIFLFLCLGVGLVLSKFLINLGITALIIRLIISPKKELIENFKQNKVFILILSLFFILNLLGLLWTQDLKYGLGDINKKILLLLIPLTIGLISPLDKRIIKLFYLFYISALLFGVLWGSVNYLIQDNPDTRKLIFSISHIRFALNLCFGIVSLTYILYKKKRISKSIRISILSVILLFAGYLFLSQAITGIVILFSMSLIYIPYHIFKHRKRYISYIILLFYLIIISYSCIWLYKEYSFYFTPNPIYNNNLSKTTPEGNPYDNLFDLKTIENGNYVYHYFCMSELTREWEKRTGLNAFERVNTQNGEGAYIDFLVRYMNSIHPVKDAEKFNKLSDKDIENIKNGITNKVYTHRFNLRPRLYKLFYQIDAFVKYGKVKNFSEIQRIELWKNSISIIKDNPIIGIGTGDIDKDFEKELIKRNSELYDSKLRAHNQYLSVMICFGVLGFILFVYWLVYPGIMKGLFSNLVYSGFFFISLMSMINEDTLDNLFGIAFFILIQSLFVFNFKDIKELMEEDKEKS